MAHRDSKTTKLSELKAGDTFNSYSGSVLTVVETMVSKSGRINFTYLDSEYPEQSALKYSHKPLADNYIERS